MASALKDICARRPMPQKGDFDNRSLKSLMTEPVMDGEEHKRRALAVMKNRAEHQLRSEFKADNYDPLFS